MTGVSGWASITPWAQSSAAWGGCISSDRCRKDRPPAVKVWKLFRPFAEAPPYQALSVKWRDWGPK